MKKQNTGVELGPDTQAARDELEIPVRNVHGALALWNIMTAAHRMAAAYVEDFRSLRYEAKLAYTKALVTEYWRPWSGNNNHPGLSSAADSKEFKVLRQASIHEELKELRNCVVAHADADFEAKAFELLGAPVTNDKPDLHPRTLLDVFVPVRVNLASASLWWLDDTARLAEIRDHIEQCAQAAVQRIHVSTRHLLSVALKHIHVLEHTGLFTLQPLPTTAPGQFQVPSADTLPQPPTLASATELQVGSQNVQSLVTVYGPSAFIAQGPAVRGNGFVLTVVPGATPDSLSWTVSFPSRNLG